MKNRYGTSTNKSDNHVVKCSNKNEHIAKEPYFKVYAFMLLRQSIVKKNCYFMNFTYIKWIRYDELLIILLLLLLRFIFIYFVN